MSLPGSPPWSKASAPIWAHVSGYAWPARCDKPLVFFRAFVDDSGSESGDRRLFLAGYLNRVEAWALFADAWAEELRATPSIEYLKMVEAQNLRDQFKGWLPKERDEKLRGLARVIRHFEPMSFEMSLNREYFDRVLKPVSPRGLASAHFACCGATIVSVARFAAKAKMKGQIEFIFDEQDGVSSDMDLFFEQIKPHFPKKARQLIAGKPLFRDDKEFTPLQAADMLAWHIRREHEDSVQLPMANLLKNSRGHLISEIPEHMIARWADHGRHLPGIESLSTKRQWRSFKEGYSRQIRDGANPATLGRPPLFKRVLDRIRLSLRAALSRWNKPR